MAVLWPGSLTACSVGSGPAQDGRGPDQMFLRNQLDVPNPDTKVLAHAHSGLRVLAASSAAVNNAYARCMTPSPQILLDEWRAKGGKMSCDAPPNRLTVPILCSLKNSIGFRLFLLTHG